MKLREFFQPRQLKIDFRKQSPEEITSYLQSISKEWTFTYTDDGLIFVVDDKPALVIPLATIYRASIIDKTLYILCSNGVLHCVGRKMHDHRIIIIGNMEDDIFPQMLN